MLDIKVPVISRDLFRPNFILKSCSNYFRADIPIVICGCFSYWNKVCPLENTRRFAYKQKSSASEFYSNTVKFQSKTNPENCQAARKNSLPLPSVYLADISIQYFFKRLDLLSNEKLWNSDNEILAKSQTLSLELKNFSFSGSISTLSGCADGTTIFRNKTEYVDPCSKDVFDDVKIFENRKWKNRLLRLGQHENQ